MTKADQLKWMKTMETLQLEWVSGGLPYLIIETSASDTDRSIELLKENSIVAWAGLVQKYGTGG